MRFLLNWIMTAIALAIAVWFIPGLSAFGAEPWLCFLFVSLFLGIVNTLVKPFLSIISLPITFFSLGVFQLIINTFMLELASWLSVSFLGAGISIASFGSAFVGAIIVSILCAILGVTDNEG